MKSEISERTVELIAEHLGEMEVPLPLDSDSLIDVLNFFDVLEASLAQDYDSGDLSSKDLLEDVCRAVDELNLEDDAEIDMNGLNERIRASMSGH
jgi:hypothetical protein